MINVVIITHGLFGQELLRTAQDIVGRQEAVAALSVTAEMGVDSLSRAIDELMGSLSSQDGVLFLVDMLGGTPCNTALVKSRGQKMDIVSGVNLYMVLSSFRHRPELDLQALAAKVAEDGRRAIVLPKELLSRKIGA